MVGASRVSKSRSNASIAFRDEVFVREIFPHAISPIPSCLRMEFFRKRFRKSIRQSLGHDRAVIIVLTLIPLHQLLGSDSRGDCEGSHVIRLLTAHLGQKIRQTKIRLLGPAFLPLLTKHQKPQFFLAACLVRIHHDVVAIRVRRPKTIDRATSHRALLMHLPQHLLAMIQ